MLLKVILIYTILYTCALVTSGALTGHPAFICPEQRQMLYSQGYNENSQLGRTGDSTLATRDTLRILTGTPATIHTRCSSTVFGLTETGQLIQWGFYSSGILCNSTITATSNTPRFGCGSLRFKTVGTEGQNPTAAWGILTNNSYVTWGSNNFGQRGIGSTSASPFHNPIIPPVLVGVNISHASSGSGFMVAYSTVLNRMYTWGSTVSSGQLGNGATSGAVLIPTITMQNIFNSTSSTRVKILRCISNFCVMVLNNGTLMSWGGNAYGQLGIGSTSLRSTPAVIPGIIDSTNDPIVDVALGSTVSTNENHVVVLFESGLLAVWGANSLGQLGTMIGTTQVLTPTFLNISVAVPSMEKYIPVSVDAGSQFTVVTMSDAQTVVAFGSNNNGRITGRTGQIGVWTSGPLPVTRAAGNALLTSHITDISTGTVSTFISTSGNYDPVKNGLMIMSDSLNIEHIWTCALATNTSTIRNSWPGLSSSIYFSGDVAIQLTQPVGQRFVPFLPSISETASLLLSTVMTRFSCTFCNLQGTIPESMYNATSILRDLELFNNNYNQQSFRQVIRSSNLMNLFLVSNQFTSIPDIQFTQRSSTTSFVFSIENNAVTTVDPNFIIRMFALTTHSTAYVEIYFNLNPIIGCINPQNKTSSNDAYSFALSGVTQVCLCNAPISPHTYSGISQCSNTQSASFILSDYASTVSTKLVSGVPSNYQWTFTRVASICNTPNGWYGIRCSADGRIIRLYLNELPGTSAALASFPFSALKDVERLHIVNSGYTGPLPLSIFSLSTLKRLVIKGMTLSNLALPSNVLTNLTRLEYLELNGCALSGSLPTFYPTTLKHLDLSNNLFSQTFNGIETLPNVYSINLSGNTFFGLVKLASNTKSCFIKNNKGSITFDTSAQICIY